MAGSDQAQRIVRVGAIAIGNRLPFVLIAGPCQIESARTRWRWPPRCATCRTQAAFR